MMSDFDPALFPTSQVFGISEIVWSIRDYWYRRRSRQWQIAVATVDGREFLRWAANAGWFSICYTYSVGGEVFSGEFRFGIISRESSAERDRRIIDFSARVPPGTRIQVRTDPSNPMRSFAELS